MRPEWTVEDLEVFKRAYAISLDVHKASQDFPRNEQFGGVADQLRRASKSVCGLIAEGAGRQRGSQVEFKRYLIMALGSVEEANCGAAMRTTSVMSTLKRAIVGAMSTAKSRACCKPSSRVSNAKPNSSLSDH